MEDEFVDMCVELVYVPNGFDAEAGHRFVDETEPRVLMAGSLAAHPVGWRSSLRSDARFDPEAPMRRRRHGDDEEWAEVYEALHDEAGTQVAEMHAGVACIDALSPEERDRYWAAVTETAHMFVDALARVPDGDYVWVEGVGVGGGGVVWSVGVDESSVDDHPSLDTLHACKQVFPTVARAMGAYLPRDWTSRGQPALIAPRSRRPPPQCRSKGPT